MREEDGETIYGVNSEKLAYEGKQRKKIAGGAQQSREGFCLVLLIGDRGAQLYDDKKIWERGGDQ